MTVADPAASTAASSTLWRRLRPATITGQLAALGAALLVTVLVAGAALVSQAAALGRTDPQREALLTNRRDSSLVLVEDYARLDLFHALLAAGTNSPLRTQRLALMKSTDEDLHTLIQTMVARPANADVKAGFDAFARAHERNDRVLDRAVQEYMSSGGRDVASADDAVGGGENDALNQLQSLNERIQTLVTQSERARVERVSTRINEIVVVGLLLLAALGAASVVVVRRLVRPVVELTTRAEVAARSELPAAMAQIRTSEHDATPVLEPVRVGGATETVRLAEAFDEVRSTAVDLAVAQRRVERNSAQMLVNLGHRNQNLLNRTLAYITELERTEQDPDVLDRLFRLDHATTRIRRNAESMLVLAGADQTRTWSRPAPMVDVIRAALSEIEDYERVDVYHVQHGGLTGSVVADVVHLLAELMENAANFSPPSTAVTVVGQLVPEGYRIRIIDEGIGMTRGELDDANRTVQQAPGVRTASKLLGLYVVGRLAARRGIKVTLEASGGRGVTASVLLPAALLAEVAPGSVRPSDDVEPAPRVLAAEAAPLVLAAAAVPALAAAPSPALAAAPATAPVPAAAPAAPVSHRPAPAEQALTSAPAASSAAASSAAASSAAASSAAAVTAAFTVPPAPAAPAAPTVAAQPALAVAPAATPRRVPGAQLPDLDFGQEADPDLADLDAADVRGRLSSLQAGVAAGRQADVADLPVRPEPALQAVVAEPPTGPMQQPLTEQPRTEHQPSFAVSAAQNGGAAAVPVRVPGAQLLELGLLDDAPDTVLSPAPGEANRWKLRSFQLDVDAARRVDVTPDDFPDVSPAVIDERPVEEA